MSDRGPMTTQQPETGTAAVPFTRRQIAAWCSYDWGGAAFNAVINTFVFSVYLTSAVAGDDTGGLSGETQLGIAMGLAGLVIALLAPVMGQRADAGGRRKRNLGIWTILILGCMFAMYFVKADPDYLLLGLVLISVANIFNELAGVSYNAMLKQVSTPETVGRVSGIGWSMGYFGGIFLLLIVLVGFIQPNLLGISTDEGLNIRLVAVFSAVWFLVFAIPLFIAVPELPRQKNAPPRVGFLASYKVLIDDVVRLYRRDRNAVFFLIASALYRDGLAAVFTFGAVLAKSVYGLSSGDVIIFGVAANVVAALGALSAGFIEDRIGPKPIILVSIGGLIAAAGVLLFVQGPTMFWIFGLALCLWVGPAQSASRTFLARLAPPGHEGQMFGLYTTTGRAVSFLAPGLFALFSGVFHSSRAGIIGIAIVLLLGGAALLGVRPPKRA